MSDGRGVERLAPCPDAPNCVSTLAKDPEQAMPPLAYELPEERVMGVLEEIVLSLPRARVVERRELYLHAELTSQIFRFVDDVELALDPEAHRIHFRSASRTGYSDLGVNRRRMAEVSRRLAERDGISIEASP